MFHFLNQIWNIIKKKRIFYIFYINKIFPPIIKFYTMDEVLRAKLIEEEILLFEKNILPEIEAEWPIPEKRPHRHSIKELRI